MNQETRDRLSRLIQTNVNSYGMPLELAIAGACYDLFGPPQNLPCDGARIVCMNTGEPAEDEQEEQQRRDEKHGLYGGAEDIANWKIRVNSKIGKPGWGRVFRLTLE